MNIFAGLWRTVLARRTWILVGLHIVLVALAYELALRLRFEWEVPDIERNVFWASLPWIVSIKLACFWRFGNLHGWWRYVTFADLAALLRVATISTLVIAAVDYFAVERSQISRAVLALDWGTTVLLIGGLRSLGRLTREHVIASSNGGRPALLIAGARSGDALARLIHHQPGTPYRVVGFLHENRAYHGSQLGGIPFLGSPDDAVAVAAGQGVADVLVMTSSLSGAKLRELLGRCERAHIKVRMLPSVNELLNGSFGLRARDVDIADLLRREPVRLDSEAIDALLMGRRVLVTGAGGSIGSEICRQVLQRRPAALILVERAENNLFYIDRELRGHRGTEADADGLQILPCLADIRDEERMEAIFRQHRPQIVFHAAAHKHVPLMELNPGEAIKNNVLGTMALCKLADRYQVEHFTLISTDKAVNPTSVMGISKQLAERFVHAYSEISSTRFVVVRFGNVLASSGSVVPIFQEQIRRGGPVTVTHPDMERYFMTIPEASQLVLQAAAMGRGGEIFVLDMGEPVKIVDLARDMIRLSGVPAEEIEIQFTGIRPGEKLFEELYLHDERTLPTPHPKVHVAYHRPEGLDSVEAVIAQAVTLLDEPAESLLVQLKRLVADYGDRQTRSSESVPKTQPRLTERLAVEPT